MTWERERMTRDDVERIARRLGHEPGEWTVNAIEVIRCRLCNLHVGSGAPGIGYNATVHYCIDRVADQAHQSRENS